MHHRLSALPLLAAIVLTAGCQPPAAAPTQGAAAVAPVAEGHVQLDVQGLLASAQTYRTQKANSLTLPGATHLRVRVRVPGTATPIEKIVTAGETSIALSVPASKNCIFELAAIYRDGTGDHVMQQAAAVGDVAATGTTTIKPLPAGLQVAVALKVFHDALLDNTLAAESKALVRDYLTNKALGAWITDSIYTMHYFSDTLNQSSGSNPALISGVRLGQSLLSWAYEEPLPLDRLGRFKMSRPSASVDLHLSGVTSQADVTLLAPGARSYTMTNGIRTWFNVPPGTWTVYAQEGDKKAWGTVTLKNGESQPVEVNLSSGPSIDHWLFKDTTQNNWSVSASQGSTLEIANPNQEQPNPGLHWTIPAGDAPQTLTFKVDTAPTLTDAAFFRAKVHSTEWADTAVVKVLPAEEGTLDPDYANASYTVTGNVDFLLPIAAMGEKRNTIKVVTITVQGSANDRRMDFDDVSFTQLDQYDK